MMHNVPLNNAAYLQAHIPFEGHSSFFLFFVFLHDLMPPLLPSVMRRFLYIPDSLLIAVDESRILQSIHHPTLRYGQHYESLILSGIQEILSYYLYFL